MARNTVYRIKADFVPRGELERRRSVTLAREAAERAAEREARRTYLVPWDGRVRLREPSRSPAQAFIEDHIHSPLVRDIARVASHGVARTGTGLLRLIDAPNRLLGLENSPYRRFYEGAEAGLAADRYEMGEAVPRLLETAVHLGTSGGVFGKALPAAFGTEVGLGTYESSRAAGMPVVEALSRGISHGVIDTAIWTAGAGLSSKYLPKAWQQLGHQITGAARGASSSLVSDMVADSANMLSDDVSMGERAVHAAWMVPLLGMLKMGGKRREEAMSLLRKARPDLAGERADKVIETIEAEFSDPRSQKVALAWVARKGANLPDDIAQIKQALEVAGKVRGLDPMSRSPFEILSDPAYARYLPKPKPQDVKAFSNMKRYPMGVIGFDVSDDAAGRQATREMINAYMSPSSNPWCLATGSGAVKLGELGPSAESYWEGHSAVPKQIFFQEVDGKLELTAFRATRPVGEGRQEYWDTSDAGYSGIPLKVKVPGDPMGRYRKMVFKPDGSYARDVVVPDRTGRVRRMSLSEAENQLSKLREATSIIRPGQPSYIRDELQRRFKLEQAIADFRKQQSKTDIVPGTFEDIAPGKVFKGDPFRDGRSQTWAEADLHRRPSDLSFWDTDDGRGGLYRDYLEGRVTRDEILWRLSEQRDAMDAEFGDSRGLEHDIDLIKNLRVEDIEGISTPEDWGSKGQYVLTEDKVRTTENGITKFRTTKYADPTDPVYWINHDEYHLEPVEIEESELVSPEWMRSRGYDPESESDVRRMQQELNIRAWGNGVEAAMAVVPTRRTYMQTKSGTPEVVTYEPDGCTIASVDFMKDGVPYRETFVPVPENARKDFNLSDLYQGDYNDLPRSDHGYESFYPTLRRLVRNPGSASEELLEDVGWNEELRSFVRTSGNRRWRIGDDPALDPEGKTLWDQYQKARRACANDYLASGQERLNNLFRRGETERAWTSWAREHGVSGDDPTRRILMEDRQPNGTWAPAVDRGVNVNTGETVELPPPPPALPVMDAKGGNARSANKGGDNFGTFRNFLATDKVPESIFGIPVVQDESQYTEKDLEFFKRNPKAAGFYEMGDEEPPAEEPPAEEPPPRMAEGAGDTDEPPRRYEVQPGDTLTKIAKTTGVPAADIAQHSKLADPGKLKVGQTLWLVKPYPGAWNNPGNVKKGEVEYEGESGSVKSTVSDDPMPFLTFSTPEAGLNAKGQAVGQMVREKIPERYREGKLPSTDFTVSNLITVYAPPSDRNDTPEYIDYVSKRLGVGKDDVLDMGDVEKMASLLEAIAERDSGRDKARWFRRSDYVNAARKMPVPAKPRKAPAKTEAKAKTTRKSRKGAAD